MVDDKPPQRAPREAAWDYRALPLGGTSRAADQIAALARMGWELEHVSAPHYGMLTLIGYFRRRVPAPPAHTRCEQ
jgi:hypothetical protein